MTLTYIFKVTNFEYFENGEIWQKLPKYDFYSDWYLPRNGTIANLVLCDFYLNFQGQTFSCYANAIQIILCSGRPKQICLDSHGPCRWVELVSTAMAYAWITCFHTEPESHSGLIASLSRRWPMGCVKLVTWLPARRLQKTVLLCRSISSVVLIIISPVVFFRCDWPIRSFLNVLQYLCRSQIVFKKLSVILLRYYLVFLQTPSPPCYRSNQEITNTESDKLNTNILLQAMHIYNSYIYTK